MIQFMTLLQLMKLACGLQLWIQNMAIIYGNRQFYERNPQKLIPSTVLKIIFWNLVDHLIWYNHPLRWKWDLKVRSHYPSEIIFAWLQTLVGTIEQTVLIFLTSVLFQVVLKILPLHSQRCMLSSAIWRQRYKTSASKFYAIGYSASVNRIIFRNK